MLVIELEQFSKSPIAGDSKSEDVVWNKWNKTDDANYSLKWC